MTASEKDVGQTWPVTLPTDWSAQPCEVLSHHKRTDHADTDRQIARLAERYEELLASQKRTGILVDELCKRVEELEGALSRAAEVTRDLQPRDSQERLEITELLRSLGTASPQVLSTRACLHIRTVESELQRMRCAGVAMCRGRGYRALWQLTDGSI